MKKILYFLILLAVGLSVLMLFEQTPESQRIYQGCSTDSECEDMFFFEQLKEYYNDQTY